MPNALIITANTDRADAVCCIFLYSAIIAAHSLSFSESFDLDTASIVQIVLKVCRTPDERYSWTCIIRLLTVTFRSRARFPESYEEFIYIWRLQIKKCKLGLI